MLVLSHVEMRYETCLKMRRETCHMSQSLLYLTNISFGVIEHLLTKNMRYIDK